MFAHKPTFDIQFLSACSIIASKHGGTIQVDKESRTVNFDVPPENEVACARELADLFKEHEVA